MSLSSFRFVHATNVRLDQPMWGIGTVEDDARRLAEDATNLAFENIVDTCIQHDAAFLLLTGNTFDAACGHRGRLILEQACELLAEHQCEVFITPGEMDPPHCWGDSIHLPGNATTFLAQHAEPVSVVRDGLTLATVEVYQDRQQGRVAGSASGMRIGLIGGQQHPELQQQLSTDADGQLDIKQLERHPSLVDFGYLALGCGSERLTVHLPRGLAHDPGCPQPLDGRQTSALGCTLIEVDASGQLQTRLMPTAVVRREEIEVQTTPDMDWDALVLTMQTAILDRDPLSSERLWLVRWIIDGEGDVIASLMEPTAQQELAELVEAELADSDKVLRIHDIEIKARWSDTMVISEAGSVHQEFESLIEEHAGEHLKQFIRGMPARDWLEAGWVRHIIDAAEQTSTRNVAMHGRTLARKHLTATCSNDR